MEEGHIRSKFERVCLLCGSNSGHRQAFIDAALELGNKPDTITGLLLAGVGNVDLRRKTNYLIVDSKTMVKQIEDAFKEFMTKEDVAIVLISQYDDENNEYKFKHVHVLPKLGVSVHVVHQPVLLYHLLHLSLHSHLLHHHSHFPYNNCCSLLSSCPSETPEISPKPPLSSSEILAGSSTASSMASRSVIFD